MNARPTMTASGTAPAQPAPDAETPNLPTAIERMALKSGSFAIAYALLAIARAIKTAGEEIGSRLRGIDASILYGGGRD